MRPQGQRGLGDDAWPLAAAPILGTETRAQESRSFYNFCLPTNQTLGTAHQGSAHPTHFPASQLPRTVRRSRPASCGLGGMCKEPGHQEADITCVVEQRMNAGEMERPWWEEGETQLLLGGVAPRCPPSKDRQACHHQV